MKGKIITTFLTIATFIAIIFPIAYCSHQKEMKCDEVVFLEGELGMDVREVYPSEDGISTIYLCDGTKMQVPTIRIVKIIEKEDVQ
jgi:hypothetical protein